MDAAVAAYVASCPSCQQHKPANASPIGLLQPLPIPASPWESVSLDFTALPKDTATGCDYALVFVCRLTKMVKICPTFSTVSAPETAKLLLDALLRHGYGIPTSLVSDRDPRFTGQFWSALSRILGVGSSMSTAYHPETDGQTERANRSFKSLLQQLTLSHGKDWVSHLPLLEFAYNNSVHAVTGYSPFFLCHGRHPRLPSAFSSSFPPEACDSANAFARHLAKSVADARRRIRAANERMCVQANRHRRDHQFAIGDLVLLDAANFDLPPFSPRFLGPFKVLECPTAVNVRLQLPAALSRRHPVFHVSKIRVFKEDPQFNRAPPVLPPEGAAALPEGRFVVKMIHEKQRQGRGFALLVEWEGYPDRSDFTWQSFSQMKREVPELVHAFESAQ